MTATKTHLDVVCAACGCVCDDLRVTTDAVRVTRVEPACPRADAWFRRTSAGTAWVKNQPVENSEAVNAAAALLRASQAPLILGRTGCAEGQRSALALAERLGGTHDTGGNAAATIAFQQVGKSSCTLGELRQRVDLVVCWGADPVVTHPRFLERYTAETATLIVLDSATSATARSANLHLRSQLGADYELLSALRGIPAGIEPATSVGGLSRETLHDLVARLRGCRSGAFLFGSGLKHGPVAHATIAAIYSLVRELNAVARFYVHELRDECGAEAVGAWQTGYSGAVNFARGYPRSNPDEFSADAVLTRGEADCCLLLDEQAAAKLSPAARSRLEKIPVIRLENAASAPADVRFAVAAYGLHAAGTAYRLDDVPLPLRPLLPTSLPTAADILDRLLAAL